MKWNESGFRPPLCTYKLNWARTTSWGWWDDWDDTVLQTQNSKFEPRRSEAEHATSRSRRLPTILTFTRGWGRPYRMTSNVFIDHSTMGSIVLLTPGLWTVWSTVSTTTLTNIRDSITVVLNNFISKLASSMSVKGQLIYIKHMGSLDRTFQASKLGPTFISAKYSNVTAMGRDCK